MKKYDLYSKGDPAKNFSPLPNEVFYLDLSYGAIAIYGYLMHIEDMVMNVLAAGMEIPDEQLKALRGRCIQDVKKTSGSISLDDAVRYQRGSL